MFFLLLWWCGEKISIHPTWTVSIDKKNCKNITYCQGAIQTLSMHLMLDLPRVTFRGRVTTKAEECLLLILLLKGPQRTRICDKPVSGHFIHFPPLSQWPFFLKIGIYFTKMKNENTFSLLHYLFKILKFLWCIKVKCPVLCIFL